MKTPEDIEATMWALRVLRWQWCIQPSPSIFQAIWELVHTLPADSVQKFYDGLAEGCQKGQEQQQKEV